MDVREIKENVIDKKDEVVDSIQVAAEKAKDGAVKLKKDIDLKRLSPVFEEDINETDFSLTKMVVIKDTDERQDNPVCEGSIGFYEKANGAKALALYTKNTSLVDANFYPIATEDVFYINPFTENEYISLDSYFSQMENLRVLELEKIAQKLGATYFKISIVKEKDYLVSKDKKAKAKGKAKKHAQANAEITIKEEIKDKQELKVCSEQYFEGGSPVRPT